MINGIVFVGGIHGVGKGALCNRIASSLGITHLSASDVLKWSDFSADPSNKQVSDVSITQERLLINLGKMVQPDRIYLLDGHFCLLNKEGKIETVPDEVFIGINPKKIIVVSEDPEIVCQRLSDRDGRSYDLSVLEQMQITERERAQHISKLLKIEVYEIRSDSDDELKNIIND